MEIFLAFSREHIIVVPTVVYIDKTRHFGYPVFDISFEWLNFGVIFRFCAKKEKQC